MAPEPTEDEPGPHDDLDELFGDQGRKSRDGSRRSARGPRRWGNRPVKSWRSSDEVDDELETPGGTEPRRVFWRARDSLWFEPLVALAVIVVLLVSLFAYTSNWPPVYVIESNSMQHGSGDHLGYLNAGDVVLAQRTSQAQLSTYFPAVQGGSSTYGEPGDVVLYYPNGDSSATPVIHRALLFLQWNQPKQAYNATGLSGLSCSNTSRPYYYAPGTPSGCGTTNLSGILMLYHIGWKDLTVTIDFSICASELGRHSGYLTLGDNNSYADQVPASCGAGRPISTLVEPGWVIGAARGLIPWFGALKLFLDGNSQLVPGTSWELLGLSLAGLVLAGAGIHFLLRRLGVRSEIRRREETRLERDLDREPEEETSDAAPRPSVRSWRAPPQPDEEEPHARPKVGYEDRRRSHFVSRSRAKRPHGPPRSGPEDEAETDEDL